MMYVSGYPFSQAWAGGQSFQPGTALQSWMPVQSSVGVQGMQGGTVVPSMAYTTPSTRAISYSFNPASSALQQGGFFSMPWSPMGNWGQAFGTPAQTAVSGGFNTIQASAMAQPRIELAETNSDIVVACELPNIALQDLNLTVTDDSLTICATAFSGGTATSLHRTIALPTSIKAEQVDASYTNGILEARLPKSDVTTRRRIKVNTLQ